MHFDLWKRYALQGLPDAKAEPVEWDGMGEGQAMIKRE
jgi:hypothetical protein